MELNPANGGTVYLFAGGTGILPFLDFLDYLLKKAIFTVANQKSKSLNRFFNENYETTFDKSFQVVLFASFATFEDFSGYNIIKKLYEISKEENLKLFDMVIRMGKGSKVTDIPTTDGMFDSEFARKYIDNTKLSRVYICGPPVMNKSVPKALRKIGISNSRIVIV